jgi:nucleoid-associated protein YgaU
MPEKDPPKTGGTGDNPYAQYYVVKKGDTLSKIALEYYGDAKLYPQIFDANRDILTDPNKIKVGQKLRIP